MLWPARINQKNLTENQLAVKTSILNVCGNGFISGWPSKLYETCDHYWMSNRPRNMTKNSLNLKSSYKFRNNDELVMYYTGLADFNTLNALFYFSEARYSDEKGKT